MLYSVRLEPPAHKNVATIFNTVFTFDSITINIIVYGLNRMDGESNENLYGNLARLVCERIEHEAKGSGGGRG